MLFRSINKRLLEMLDLIVSGKANEETLYKLKELSEIVSETSLCGLGKASPNPVLSTMNYFYDEYLAHVGDNKTCPAKRCKDLLDYTITDKCIGCTKCAKNCPGGAIYGKAREVHFIKQDVCIKCGTCMENCPVDAIVLG